MKRRLSIVIPARYGSSRLPGKPLADICGVPMIVRVARRASMVPGVHQVAVATDDERIHEVVKGAGFVSVVTSKDHPSGTDRIAEAARLLGLSEDDIVINVQGDQPLFDIDALSGMADLLLGDDRFVMTTAACPMDIHSAKDPNRVKVVVDASGGALYFSRSIIPFDRDGILDGEEAPYLRHLGLYCYRVGFLEKYVSWPEGRLESIERLEQLRVLERGYRIGVVIVDEAPPEVDTEEDLQRIREYFKAQ